MNKCNKSFILLFLVIISSCTLFQFNRETPEQADRIFTSSFESIEDFSNFYIVPPNDYDSTHELSTDIVYDGVYAHKAWILSARADNNDGLIYKPHRAYPTIQLYKTDEGSYATPCLISFWVYLDMNLVDQPTGLIDDWFSFATLSPDDSDNWSRTVVVNITPDGYIRLVHVPEQGEQEYIYQVDLSSDPSGSLKYPYREWVKIDIYIDFSSTNGYAKVWQNGILVSHAFVEGGEGALEQAHFGLYASAAVASGVVYNDKLSIQEIKTEADALLIINQN